MLGLICSMQYLQLQHENSQLQHVEPSSLTRDWNQAPASGAWSHSHWTTREVPWLFLTLISVQLPSVLHVSSVFPPPYLCFSCSSTASRDPWASFGRVEQEGAAPGVEDKLLRHCPVERPSPHDPRGEGRERPQRPHPRHCEITGSLSRGGLGLPPLQGSYWSPLDSTRNLTWRYVPPSSFHLLSLTYTWPTFPCPLASRLQLHQQWVRDQSTCLSG